MSKTVWLLIICLVLHSCNSAKKEKKIQQEPLMYEPTEMALLMRKMYEVNRVVKTQIINKDSLLLYPEEFSTIHTAILTDPSERNKEFDSISKQFLLEQMAAFTSNSDSARYHFNKSINSCISCHETRCVGPIPKIMKLLIH